MPEEVLDRRGRSERGSSGLLEREAILHAIDAALDEAARGRGQALLIEGHPGMGKTRLHEAALDLARGHAMRVLRAAGSELEQPIVFGVAQSLVNAALSELPAGERDRHIDQATAAARAVLRFGEEPEPALDANKLTAMQGLFALLADVDRDRPTLIAVDDLHWADKTSLEFLLYLLQRLDELPATIVITRRPPIPGTRDDILDRITAHPQVWVHSLGPLGYEAVERLTQQVLGSVADDTLVQACQQTTAGNPFYLRELLTTLAEERGRSSAELTRHARSLAPDAVTRIVRVRIGRLGPEAAELAGAVATLGDDVPLRLAAALAGLSLERAENAADGLASIDILLAREPLRFVHPLVRHVVAGDIPASARASRHLQAARLLYADGAPSDHVAAHLLHGRAQGDAWVVQQLQTAARHASSRGAPESALRFLERALEEPPPPELQSQVFAELGLAKAALGLAGAADDLAQARQATGDPRRQAELSLECGSVLHAQGKHEQAAAAFDQGLSVLGDTAQDTDLYMQLQMGYLAIASFVPSLHRRGMDRQAKALAQVPDAPRSQGERLVLGQAALRAAYDGRPAAEVIELAERCWDDGKVLEQAASQRLGWRLACSALCLAGELERAVELADAAVLDAERRNDRLAAATARFTRGLPRLWRGDVHGATEDLTLVMDARARGWRQFARAAAAHYAVCLIEQDRAQEAERVLLSDGAPQELNDLEDAMRLYSLAELRLGQGRAQEALDAATASGAAAERTVSFFTFCPWREVAAEAHLALGDTGAAKALALEALERAEQTGVAHLRIRAGRVAGSCEGGAAGLARLRAAAELGERTPPRLETIRALVVLGAALRRVNQRASAREPLGHAVDLAREGGAAALERLARTELAATGARPRRGALQSGLESLTASERRIAQLAASGQGNRDIAQALFITPKTVEYHLRNVFRKLGIKNRRELPAVLG